MIKFLKFLVKRNYCLRMAGKLPDEWYWADKLLIKLGHSVSIDEL